MYILAMIINIFFIYSIIIVIGALFMPAPSSTFDPEIKFKPLDQSDKAMLDRIEAKYYRTIRQEQEGNSHDIYY